VSVRVRGQGDQGAQPVERFLAQLQEAVRTRQAG
jgi:hypothetical protein